MRLAFTYAGPFIIMRDNLSLIFRAVYYMSISHYIILLSLLALYVRVPPHAFYNARHAIICLAHTLHYWCTILATFQGRRFWVPRAAFDMRDAALTRHAKLPSASHQYGHPPAPSFLFYWYAESAYSARFSSLAYCLLLSALFYRCAASID